MAQKPKAKKSSKKIPAKAAKKSASKAVKKSAKRVAAKASKRPAKKPARKSSRPRAKQTASAQAFSATAAAVKQVDQAYKAMKRMGASIERSAHLSKLMDVTAATSQTFTERMEKLQARLQAATAQYRQLYQETLARMTGGSEPEKAVEPKDEAPAAQEENKPNA